MSVFVLGLVFGGSSGFLGGAMWAAWRQITIESEREEWNA